MLVGPSNLIAAHCRCLSLVGNYQMLRSVDSLPALEHLSLSGWGLSCLRAGAAAAFALQMPTLQTLQCDDRLYWDEFDQVVTRVHPCCACSSLPPRMSDQQVERSIP